MNDEFETIIKTEGNIRVSVDEWSDGGVYLHFITRNGTLGVAFTRDEAKQMVAGFQKALNAEVMA